MNALAGLLNIPQRFLSRLSLLNRVLLGNSFIIVLGAIVGTFLTRHLALVGDLRLILLFSSAGICVTLVLNYFIIRTALRPLHELGQALVLDNIERIQIPDSLEQSQAPDIRLLVATVKSALARLEKRSRQLQALSERAITAQEEERVRIARSLHDDTAQAISMMIIHLERIEKSIPSAESGLLQKISEARQVAGQLLEDIRKIIWDLRPSILDDLGLIPAVRWYARANLEQAGVHVILEPGSEVIRLPHHLETALFRVLQETVSNILRHAGATRVSITLRPENGWMILEVRDNGCGFDVQKTSQDAIPHKQLGLLGIQERVSLLGGNVRVESAPGEGTVVCVAVPMQIEESNSNFARQYNELAEEVTPA